MKKAYIVTYVSTDGKNLRVVRDKLGLMGTFIEVTNSGRQASWIVKTESEGMSAADIRAQLFAILSPFEEGVSVVRLDVLDAADTDKSKCLDFLSDREESQVEPRNFSRFSSRHEAFVRYQIEKPKWVYKDGIGAAIAIEFSEWCWLPIRKDGIYEKGKYDKYLKD